MQDALVTVITPLYNYADYIGGCIESILAQTHQRIEMIIVDDGSTDNSAEVVAEYTRKYPNVHYLYQPKQALGKWKMGIAPALNKAIAAASGDYIAWLSADDRACPERIAKALAVFASESDPRLAMVYSNAWLEVHQPECFDQIPLPRAEIEAQFRAKGHVRWQTDFRDHGDELILTLLQHNVINGSTVLIKKQALDRVGSFDLNYPLVHDYELWLRLLVSGHVFRFLPDPLLISRVHTVNVPRWHDCQLEGYAVAREFWQHHPVEALYPPLQTRPSRALYAWVHQRLGDIFLGQRQFEIARIEYRRAAAYGPSAALRSRQLRLQGLQLLVPLYQRLRAWRTRRA